MIEKMRTADFHQDTINPILSEILNRPDLTHAIDRAKQLPKEGLKKLDIVFSSVYRRMNDLEKEAAKTGDAIGLANVKNDCEKIIQYYKGTKDLKIIEKPEDLKLDSGKNNTILHLEGGDIISDLDVIQELYERGIRSVGPLYGHDNHLGGGAGGDISRGLTPFGKQAIDKMIELGMIIDISHANHKTVQDILDRVGDYAKTVATHTGFGSSQRMITPEFLKQIAEKGGVVGFTPANVFFPTFDEYINQFKKISDEVGSVDNLAIGTDFGGLDAKYLFAELDEIGKLSIIAEKLSESGGLGDDEIEKIMYGNIERIVKLLSL